MDLKSRIKECGYTISEVARGLHITQSALSQQINNNTITFAKVEQIANIMGMPISELVSECERPAASTLVCPHCGNPIKVTLECE